MNAPSTFLAAKKVQSLLHYKAPTFEDCPELIYFSAQIF
jgi:hypothetical protein